ncbi:hypothetical protein JW979_04760 [bacterium]|nr:hypothetical protein [candidate division CSSED10-310 bacterium]
MLIVTGVVSWGLAVFRSIPDSPYIDYDEAIHAGGGLLIYDAVFDLFNNTDYVGRSFHYFSAGVIYWPFLHALLLGLVFLIFGPGVTTALVFSVTLGALTLVALSIVMKRSFEWIPVLFGTFILAFYKPFIMSSKTIMLDMLQFLFIILFIGYILPQIDCIGRGKKPGISIGYLATVGVCLSLTRITGIVLGWGGLAVFMVISAIKSRDFRFWKYSGGYRIWISFTISVMVLIIFYAMVYTLTGYNIIEAYQEQQGNLKTSILDGRYLSILTTSFHGHWEILIVIVIVHLLGMISSNKKLNYLASHLVFSLIVFQTVSLKKIRFLLPWYGFLGIYTLVVFWAYFPQKWKAKSIQTILSLALTIGFIAIQLDSGFYQRPRNTSGMASAIDHALKYAPPGSKFLVNSYAADFFIVLKDRPPKILHVNYHHGAARGFTPDFILSEENSQLDLDDAIKKYLSQSGDWKEVGRFPGDETCVLYEKAVPHIIKLQ